MKQNFLAGLLGSFVGLALLLLILNATGLVRAQGPGPQRAEATTDRITVEAQPLAPTSGGGPNQPVGTTFTYQGQLKVNSAPYTGNCDIQFALWNGTPSSGILITTVVPFPTPVPVASGLFMVYLDFGDQFQGDYRAIEPQVRCPSGSGAYQTLDAQVIYAVPYALSLRPGATVSSTMSGNVLSLYNSGAGRAAYFQAASSSAALLVNNVSDGEGVLALSQHGDGVIGTSLSTSGAGLVGSNISVTGTALLLAQGGIKVKGAGIDSDTPVFIHQVKTGMGGNICVGVPHATVIDNPLINGKSGAILILTPSNGPASSGVTSPVHPMNVIYDDNNVCGFGIGHWIIADAATPAISLVNGQRFNVLAVLP